MESTLAFLPEKRKWAVLIEVQSQEHAEHLKEIIDQGEAVKDIESKPIKKRKVFPVDELYALYPRKKGKVPGLKKLHSFIKSDDDFERVKQAIIAFAEDHRQRGTDEKYIPFFSTFVNSQLDDWLGKDANTPEQKSLSLDDINDRLPSL